MAHAQQGMAQLRGRGCWWIPGSLGSGCRHLLAQRGRRSMQAHMRGKCLEHHMAGWMAWLQDICSISRGGCRWLENESGGWPASPDGVTKQGTMMCCLFGGNWWEETPSRPGFASCPWPCSDLMDRGVWRLSRRAEAHENGRMKGINLLHRIWSMQCGYGLYMQITCKQHFSLTGHILMNVSGLIFPLLLPCYSSVTARQQT